MIVIIRETALSSTESEYGMSDNQQQQTRPVSLKKCSSVFAGSCPVSSANVWFRAAA